MKETRIGPISEQKLLDLQLEFYNGLREKGRSTNTLKNYKTDLDCFNSYLMSHKKALDINDFDLEQVKLYGHYLDNKYSSDNSRRRRVQALRMFFDFLIEKMLFTNNPVRKLPTSPKFLDIPRPTSFVDIKTLWQYLLEEEQSHGQMVSLLAKRNQIMLLLIFGGALKVSDLTNLKMDQIILPKNDQDLPRVLIEPDKRDPYTIILPKIFTPVFQEYEKKLSQVKKLNHFDFNKVLFNANPYRILSGGLSPRGIEIIFEELRKKLMIELTPKSLRQACIFKWLKDRHSDGLIKEWMGVAPSYSLKLYKDHLTQHIYNDGFLNELWQHYKKKDYSKK